VIVNAYVIIDPNGDRPYLSTSLPTHLDTKNGSIKIYHYALHVPETKPIENAMGLLEATPIVVPEKT
jgi:hypothetical protein